MSTAEHVAAPSDPFVALPTGPRIEYVIPDADPNQVIDLDYTSIADPLELMGHGQGSDDIHDHEEDDDQGLDKCHCQQGIDVGRCPEATCTDE